MSSSSAAPPTVAMRAFADKNGFSYVERGTPELLGGSSSGDRVIHGIAAGRMPSGRDALLATMTMKVTPAMREGLVEEFTAGTVQPKGLERVKTTPHPDGSATTPRYVRKFGAMVTKLPEALTFIPMLSCRDTQIRGLADRLGGPGGLLPLMDQYEFESIALNNSYRIGAFKGTSENRIRQLFSPSFIDWLASSAPAGTFFELFGGVLLVTVEGEIAEESDVERVRAIGEHVAERIRSEASEGGGASGVGASPLPVEQERMRDLDEQIAKVDFPSPPASVADAAKRFTQVAEDAGDEERKKSGFGMRMLMRVVKGSLDRERAKQLGLEAVLRTYASSHGLDVRSTLEWMQRRATIGLAGGDLRVLAGPLPGDGTPCELVVRSWGEGRDEAAAALLVVFPLDDRSTGVVRVVPHREQRPLYIGGFAVSGADGDIEISKRDEEAARAALALGDGRLAKAYDVTVAPTPEGSFPALGDKSVEWLLGTERVGRRALVIDSGALAFAADSTPLADFGPTQIDDFCGEAATLVHAVRKDL